MPAHVPIYGGEATTMHALNYLAESAFYMNPRDENVTFAGFNEHPLAKQLPGQQCAATSWKLASKMSLINALGLCSSFLDPNHSGSAC